MDDDSSLEQELERLVLEDELLVSTPRQRLEDARAMADGVVLDCCDDGSLDRWSEEEGELIIHGGMNDVHRHAETEEEKQEESAHLLQVSYHTHSSNNLNRSVR